MTLSIPMVYASAVTDHLSFFMLDWTIAKQHGRSATGNYLWGGQSKPSSAETVIFGLMCNPNYYQRSGKSLSGSREPKKSGWSHFA